MLLALGLVLALAALLLVVVPIALLRRHAATAPPPPQPHTTEAEALLLSRPFVLVHAHADDEVMFFLPTLQLLRARLPPALYAQSLVVCMTSNPLLRATEYGACAAQLLGLAPSQVRVVHCPEPSTTTTTSTEAASAAAETTTTLVTVGAETGLWDGFAHRYAAEVVADTLVRVLPRGFDWRGANFVTFDAHGVSGHPNHIDVARGVRHACAVHGGTVFALDSVPCAVKYVPALYALRFALLASSSSRSASSDSDSNRTSVVAVCSATARHTLLHALRHVYRSQLVWYRCCFAVLSMYAYCNTLRIVQ